MTRRRLPALSADEVVRALQRAGFSVHRIKGSVITICAIPTGRGHARSFQGIAAICHLARYGRSSGRRG